MGTGALRGVRRVVVGGSAVGAIGLVICVAGLGHCADPGRGIVWGEVLEWFEAVPSYLVISLCVLVFLDSWLSICGQTCAMTIVFYFSVGGLLVGMWSSRRKAYAGLLVLILLIGNTWAYLHGLRSITSLP